MTLTATDSSISHALPQRLLASQMPHDWPAPLYSPELPTVTASAQGLSDELSCRFNYPVVHSATHSAIQFVHGLQLEDCTGRTSAWA